MFKKILGFVGIGMGVLIVVGYIYISKTRSRPMANMVNIKAVQQPPAGTSTAKAEKKPAEKIVKTAVPAIPVMPIINRVLPDQDIEKIGIKIAQEKTKGLPARPECYRVVISIPEKRIKTINCQSGLIVFNSEEAMSGVEVMLAVNNYDGVDYYSLADEKGSVEFKYAVIEGDLNGQTRKTTKIFALGMIGSNLNKEYVILECPDVLSPELSNGIRTICLSPVIAGIGSQDLARKVLEQECYLDKESLKLLLPPLIEVSQK